MKKDEIHEVPSLHKSFAATCYLQFLPILFYNFKKAHL